MNSRRRDQTPTAVSCGSVKWKVAPLISVINDDTSFCLALVGILHSLGYDARGFALAEEFLDPDAIERPHCVNTDIDPPRLSGIDLKISLSARRNTVPVIMITASDDPNLRRRAQKSGAICLLHKPFETNTLAECFAKAVDT